MYKTTVAFFFIAVCAMTVQAQNICPLDVKSIPPKEISSLEFFEKIAVLEEGRIKPVDTYAQNLLLQFSGRKTLNKMDSSRWLLKLLFAPQHASDDKIFLINNPDIAAALGIAPEKKRRYSFEQIGPHFTKLQQLAAGAQRIDPKERDVVENELIRLFHNVRRFSDLTAAFSFTFPHADFYVNDPSLKQQLDFPPGKNQFSFIDIALKADILQKLMAEFERKEQEQWSPLEAEIVRIVSNLFQWTQIYRGLPFHIVPSYTRGDKAWLSPWDALNAGLHTQEAQAELASLNQMVVAYWQGSQLDFDMNAKLFTGSVHQRLKVNDPGALAHIKTEYLYNRLKLFSRAKFLFLLVVFLFLVSLVKPFEVIHTSSWLVTWVAFVALVTGIIFRIVILKRPPVSNLYETFIFVGFVSVLCGLIIERVNRQWLGLVISAVSGFTFLTIAGKFSMEGDTLQMLVAVLNSNFWLGTHVLSITTGYAGVCVAGIVGHVYILRSIFKPAKREQLNATYRVLIGSLGFGLTMTFLGTNLGGIWADQSWGRFWGWDPKENGALLIILWTALLFHARVGKMLQPLGMAVGSALGIVVVMWAWFGVNLLSIGLHSYGFTSGLAQNLAVYVVVQILFLVIAAPLAQKRLKAFK